MKNARQEQILRLIASEQIETQEELASRLNRAGFSVAQATVSRDIRELKLRKAPGAVHRRRTKRRTAETAIRGCCGMPSSPRTAHST